MYTSIKPPKRPNTSLSAYVGGAAGEQTINKRSATGESREANG